MIRRTWIIKLIHKDPRIGSIVYDDSSCWDSRQRAKAVIKGLRRMKARVFGLSKGTYPPPDRTVRSYHTSPIGTWTKNHDTGEIAMGKFLNGPWQVDKPDFKPGDLVKGPSETVYLVLEFSDSLVCETEYPTSSEYSSKGEVVEFPAWQAKRFEKVGRADQSAPD